MKTKHFFAICICLGLMLLSIVGVNNYTSTKGLYQGGNLLWKHSAAQELSDELSRNCDSDEEKVRAFSKYILDNIEYKEDEHYRIQTPDIENTLKKKTGMCYDISALMAVLCREQNIPCYLVSGCDETEERWHSWNVVKLNGQCYFVDLTSMQDYFLFRLTPVNSSSDVPPWFAYHATEIS